MVDGLSSTLAQVDGLLRNGDAATALQELKQAVKLYPQAVEARWRYGRLLQQQGEPAKALKQFNRLVSLLPERLDVLQAAASAALSAGRSKEAVRLWERALAQGMDVDVATEGLARSLMSRGDLEGAWRRAEERYQEGGQIDDGLFAVLEELATALRREPPRAPRGATEPRVANDLASMATMQAATTAPAPGATSAAAEAVSESKLVDAVGADATPAIAVVLPEPTPEPAPPVGDPTASDQPVAAAADVGMLETPAPLATSLSTPTPPAEEASAGAGAEAGPAAPTTAPSGGTGPGGRDGPPVMTASELRSQLDGGSDGAATPTSSPSEPPSLPAAANDSPVSDPTPLAAGPATGEPPQADPAAADASTGPADAPAPWTDRASPAPRTAPARFVLSRLERPEGGPDDSGTTAAGWVATEVNDELRPGGAWPRPNARDALPEVADEWVDLEPSSEPATAPETPPHLQPAPAVAPAAVPVSLGERLGVDQGDRPRPGAPRSVSEDDLIRALTLLDPPPRMLAVRATRTSTATGLPELEVLGLAPEQVELRLQSAAEDPSTWLVIDGRTVDSVPWTKRPLDAVLGELTCAAVVLVDDPESGAQFPAWHVA